MPLLLGAADAPKVFGLSVGGLGSGSVGDAQDTAAKLNKRLDVINVFEAWAWQRPLPIALLQDASNAGTLVEITWEPWKPDAGVEQPDYSVVQIAQGRYDEYISGWARDSARFGARLLIRFGQEMNGNWYPWSVRANGGSPPDYVAAFRHVHQLFSDAGASNVEWVWSPNVILGGDVEAIVDAYPGDDVVDIVGVDGYNFGDGGGQGWTPPAQLFLETLNLLNGVAPGKPMWLNEVGCSRDGGDRFAWWSELVGFLQGTSVSGLLPFEVDKVGREWRIAGSPEDVERAKVSLAAW